MFAPLSSFFVVVLEYAKGFFFLYLLTLHLQLHPIRHVRQDPYLKHMRNPFEQEMSRQTVIYDVVSLKVLKEAKLIICNEFFLPI